MSKALIVLVLLGYAAVMLGAEPTFDQEYEQQDAIVQDIAVWQVCNKVFRNARRPMRHVGHTHEEGKSKSMARQIREMRDDIRENGCRRIFKLVTGERR